jgi:hypothetical protein
MIVGTGKDIIDRIFESITITYQQINQDMNMNTGMIITIFNNQFSNFSDTVISNFNILKLDFQTIDRNDQMILLSNNELKNNIQTQSTMLKSMNENINNIPNVINYIFQETIEQIQYSFKNPIVTIQNIFTVVSQIFISESLQLLMIEIICLIIQEIES